MRYIIKWVSGDYVLKVSGCSFCTKNRNEATRMTKDAAIILSNEWNEVWGRKVMEIEEFGDVA